MSVDVFRNAATEVPHADKPEHPIDRFSMDVSEIGGRKEQLPARFQSDFLRIFHAED